MGKYNALQNPPTPIYGILKAVTTTGLFWVPVPTSLGHAGRLADGALPVLGPLEAVGEGLVVEEGLVDLLLGVEDEGAVLDNGLVQRETGNDDCRGVLVKRASRRKECGQRRGLEGNVPRRVFSVASGSVSKWISSPSWLKTTMLYCSTFWLISGGPNLALPSRT